MRRHRRVLQRSRDARAFVGGASDQVGKEVQVVEDRTGVLERGRVSLHLRSVSLQKLERCQRIGVPLAERVDDMPSRRVRVAGHRYFRSPCSASYRTLARSRMKGVISPSLIALATVTGSVRNSQTVASATITTSTAIAAKRLRPTCS